MFVCTLAYGYVYKPFTFSDTNAKRLFNTLILDHITSSYGLPDVS